MARSTPTFDYGTIPGPSGVRDALYLKICEVLTDHQSNGEDAWELTEEISGVSGSYDRVYHSVGDRSLGSGSNKGDTDIYLRITQYGGGDDFRVRIYQDWSSTSGTGYREANSAAFKTSLADGTSLDWWSVVNEYEVVFTFVQGGTYSTFVAGNTIRPYSDVFNGVARITSQSGTGSGVTIGLDRDISSNIQPGQIVWLVNQTPAATSLQSVGIDLCTVVSVSSNSITVNGVTNTYAVGSLLGIDPAPSYVSQSMGTTFYHTTLLDGTYASATGQASVLINPGTTAITEADFDPAVHDGLYYGFQPYLKMSASPAGMRGKLQHTRIFTYGAQADVDVMEVDFDSAQRWLTFVTQSYFSGWMSAIGPGAP